LFDYTKPSYYTTYIDNQHYKFGDMFRVIEPSSVQFLKPSNGTFISPSL